MNYVELLRNEGTLRNKDVSAEWKLDQIHVLALVAPSNPQIGMLSTHYS